MLWYNILWSFSLSRCLVVYFIYEVWWCIYMREPKQPKPPRSIAPAKLSQSSLGKWGWKAYPIGYSGLEGTNPLNLASMYPTNPVSNSCLGRAASTGLSWFPLSMVILTFTFSSLYFIQFTRQTSFSNLLFTFAFTLLLQGSLTYWWSFASSCSPYIQPSTLLSRPCLILISPHLSTRPLQPHLTPI